MVPHSRDSQARILIPEESPRPVVAPPRRSGQHAWILLLGILLCAGIAWRWLQAPAIRKPAPAPVRTAKVRTAPLERTLRVTGITTAEKFSALMAPYLIGNRHMVGGYGEFLLILQELAKPGAYVHKGDVVAEFDRQYMLSRLDDYRAMVLQHELNLKRLRALLDVRRKSYEQIIRSAQGRVDKTTLEVRKSPVLSANQGERLQLLNNEAKDRFAEYKSEAKFVDISEVAAMRASELDYQQAQIELRRAEMNAARMVVSAPIDGLVVMQTIRRGTDMAPIEEGDQLQPGQPYMQIVDERSLVVNASANQVDAEQLRTGMHARVRFDAYPDIELPARLTMVAAMARQGGWRASYVRHVPIRFKLDKRDPRVVPNLTANVEVVLESRPNTSVVPLECVFRDGPDATPYAWVQTESGWEKRDIDLGMSSYVAAEVRSGLSGGDVVAAEPPRP